MSLARVSAAALLAVTVGASAATAPAPRPTSVQGPPSVPSADWSGLWVIEFGKSFMRPGQEQPVFTPEYAAKYQVLVDAATAGHPMVGPETYCIPPGMPLIMAQPYPNAFLFTPGQVTIIQEAFSQVRTVYLDGRGHPDDPNPTFNGNSIGHWEGDTLVVDTNDLRADTYFQMFGHGPASFAPHSDQLHIVERIRLTGPDALEDALTLTDPKALAQPWHILWTYVRHRDWTLREYVCQENNREAASPVGIAKPVEGK